ncbi:PhzF family isomerase [Variovorax sp. H27-G14]|uniref:PhzF family isomerase n=1 Tax=Variovorax sp. H27-G14 TaxID=3111914 RepID=UPI0038FC36EB
MKTPQLFHVDAFTRVAFRGNSAGVVLDADGMSPAQMQALARELKHSETAFVLAPEDASHEVRIRYFTPTTEVPICGHATIAAHYARALALGLGETELRQKTGAGIQSIRIERAHGDYRVVMRQGAIEFGAPFASDLRHEIAHALGMTAHDLLPGAPLQVVSTGHSKVMVPMQSVNTLDALAPNHEALTALSARIGCNGYFPFVIDPVERATCGRMFAPAIGIPEDPVTGNANGPLGAYLVRHRLMPHDGRCLAFTGHQGRAIGRDGEVHVEVTVHEGEPVQVTIKGDAVLLFSAPLRL